MTAVQVNMNRHRLLLVIDESTQDVFMIPEGTAGALAELERRKFTAEEGVRKLEKLYHAFRGPPKAHVFPRITSLC